MHLWKVRLITDKETNKPRGYGFIEYMHTRDMKTAYKQADGRKLDNRRVLVDVERGRTVPNWRPRRLGGGLGSTRVGGEEVNQKHSGREQQQQIASGGPPRSEEPRVRDDRPRDQEREKSRERIRDREREREKSHDRPHDRIRDRDPPREDSRLPHPRDRDRYRDKDRDRDRGRDQDRVRSRDERDRGRDYDRDRPRERERGRERERDYDRPSHEKDRGYPRGRDVEYDHLEPARDREPASREREVGHGGYDDGGEEWYNEPLIKHRRERDYDHYEKPRSQERYDRLQTHDLDEPERGAERLKQHDPDYYDREPYDKLHIDGGLQDPEPREEGEAVEEHDYAYQRSERSLSREYKG